MARTVSLNKRNALLAFLNSWGADLLASPIKTLSANTGCSEKLCLRMAEELFKEGFVDHAGNWDAGWITRDGEDFLLNKK